MSQEQIYLEHVTDTSYRITLNRPEKANAINEEMIETLDCFITQIQNDDKARLVEITAAGEKFFSAGGDIKAWSKYSPIDMGRKWIRRGNEVFNRLRKMPQLTVANVNGHAMGGGLELALCCDIKLSVPTAKFCTPEVSLGMVSGWMGMEKVVSLVGPNVAREMLLLGRKLTAEEAAQTKLINRVIERESMASEIENIHQQILKCGPVALAHIKDFIISIESRNDQLSHQLLAGLMAASADCQVATKAFANKESWTFSNK